MSDHSRFSWRSDDAPAAEAGLPGPTRAEAPARVLVVDDHPAASARLTQTIDAEPDLVVCGRSADVDGAIVAVGVGRPDVVVVDLSVEDGEGLELVRRLHERFPRVRTLVHSMYAPALYAGAALRSGAHGYVSKARPAQSVVAGIREVLRGGIYLDAGLPGERDGHDARTTRSHARI